MESEEQCRQTVLWLNTLDVSRPGELLKAAEAASDPFQRKKLHMECAYFSGDLKACIALTRGPYPQDLRAGSTLLLRMAASMATGDYAIFSEALKTLKSLAQCLNGRPEAVIPELIQGIIDVSLYNWQSCPQWILSRNFDRVPQQMKLYAFYLPAKYLLVQGKYEEVVAMIRTVLTLCPEHSEALTQIYLNLMLTIALVGLQRREEAQKALDAAMVWMVPAGFVMPVVEHYPALGNLLSPYDTLAPDFMNKVNQLRIEVGYHFVEFHNKLTHNTVTHLLTPREYEVAYLAKAGYRNQEIANALGISVETVKSYLQVVYEKLYIKSRKELEKQVM